MKNFIKKLGKLVTGSKWPVTVEKKDGAYVVTAGGRSVTVSNAEHRGNGIGGGFTHVENFKNTKGEFVEISDAGNHVTRISIEEYNKLFVEADTASAQSSAETPSQDPSKEHDSSEPSE